VTAFTVSIYSCVYRPYVPFKSPAGETSETVAPDRGIRAIGEKVGLPLLKVARAKCLYYSISAMFASTLQCAPRGAFSSRSADAAV